MQRPLRNTSPATKVATPPKSSAKRSKKDEASRERPSGIREVKGAHEKRTLPAPATERVASASAAARVSNTRSTIPAPTTKATPAKAKSGVEAKPQKGSKDAQEAKIVPVAKKADAKKKAAEAKRVAAVEFAEPTPLVAAAKPSKVDDERVTLTPTGSMPASVYETASYTPTMSPLGPTVSPPPPTSGVHANGNDPHASGNGAAANVVGPPRLGLGGGFARGIHPPPPPKPAIPPPPLANKLPTPPPRMPTRPPHSMRHGRPPFLDDDVAIPPPPRLPSPTFQVGDKAVHPAHGLGEVTAIEKRDIGGSLTTFYVLRIFDNGMKVMVPTSATSQVGLREVMSPQEAEAILETMRAREVAVDVQPWSRRFRIYTEMIKSKSPQEVAKVLRDMHRLKFDKDLSFGERRLLDQAKSLLMKELALAKRVSEAQLEVEVMALFSA